MLFSAHRINTIFELNNIDKKFGIECDIREYNGKLILSHDPYVKGEIFLDFIKNYNHNFIIINIKTSGIANDILLILNQFNINNYFFLDLSIPEIILLSKKTNKIAIRLSEYEPIENVILYKNLVKWVWVDCFNDLYIDNNMYKILRDNNFKICLVSPELQNHSCINILKFKKLLYDSNIFVDMICTKNDNINKWAYDNVQLIIPMSGLGERFIKEGYNDPKPLIKIENKYMIEHVVNIFPNITDVTFICNDLHLKTTKMLNILKNINNNAKIHEIPLHKYGPVYAILSVIDNIDDNKEVIVSYCDYSTSWDFNKF